MERSRVFLAGLSGVGKSSIARRLAAWLGWPAHDVDREVERATGASIAEHWRTAGEPAFRAAERDAIARLTALPGSGVIALGGGALEDAASAARLAAWGCGVFLDAPVETLARRVTMARGPAARGEGSGRPLLEAGDPLEVLGALAARRAAGFAALPHRVSATGASAAAVAVEVLRALEWPAPEPVADGVWLGRNALAHAGAVLARGGPTEGRSAGLTPLVVATDARVWALHGDPLLRGLVAAGWNPAPCPLPAGEAAKRPAGLVRVWDALAAAGAERDSPCAALGGGAVGDVAGLAAATFKRGLPLTLFPTTLLAQVDAAIGGKNAINLAGVKNLIGTFHPPATVVSDSLCLLTLTARAYRSGWAEVVKTAVLNDPDLLALCEREPTAIRARRLEIVEEAVARAARVKSAVVATDPREADERRRLNLGHTLGHALEAASGGALTHGEAVAIGLVAAARLSAELGVGAPDLADRLAAALVGLGLPARVPEAAPPAARDPEQLLALIGHDKKRRGGQLHVVLPVRPGETIIQPVAGDVLRRWVEEAVR
ncbi:MAG: bifunctional shikimate kinase/3-dehydroquinate synthase [Gemmatimonadota bacterium]